MTGQSYLHVPVSKTAMYTCELQYQLQSLIQCTNWNLYVNINIKDIVVHPALSLPSSAGAIFGHVTSTHLLQDTCSLRDESFRGNTGTH